MSWLKAFFPKYSASSPTMDSILSNWLYFSILSDLHKDPVLIWEIWGLIEISAIVESDVSPDRGDITDVYPFLFAKETASKVSLKVPIWFGLIKIENRQLNFN